MSETAGTTRTEGRKQREREGQSVGHSRSRWAHFLLKSEVQDRDA